MMTRIRGARPRRPVPGVVLRVLTAATLAIVAYVHADLAPVYAGVHASVSEGTLFRIEAGAASAAAALVLFLGRRAGFALALIVAAGALGAILMYRYVDVGQLGPFPNMYEPSWFPEKAVAACAAGAAVILALGGLLAQARHPASGTGGGRGMARLRPSVAVVAAAIAIGVVVAASSGSSGGTRPSGSAAGGSHSSPAGGPSAGRVTIEGTNSLTFLPMTVKVRTGAVRITLKDMGSYPHNLVIPSLHVKSATVTGDPGGTSVSFTVTFPRRGRYPFYCQYHQSAGMTGVFVVS